MDKSIFCIGGATIDHKLKSFAPIIKACSNPVESHITFGGVARNIAANLAQWTHRIHLQCIVGNDDDGQRLLGYMQTLGVNIDASIMFDAKSTAHYYAILNEQGLLHLAVNDFHIYHDIQLELLETHWQTWPDESIIFIDANMPKKIIDAMRTLCLQTQSLLCIDPVSVIKSANVPENLNGVFIIKPNQLEASVLSGININTLHDCFSAAHVLLNRGVEYVIISLGNNGCVIANQNEEHHVSCHPSLNIVDTSGAGDAFFAGILFGIQKAMPIKDACEIGHAAAAITLQSMHNVGKIPLTELLHAAKKYSSNYQLAE